MAQPFKPPPVESHQGADPNFAQPQQSPGQTGNGAPFTPPPPFEDLGGQLAPAGMAGRKIGPVTLPDITNEDLARWWKGALKLAPVAGATAATAMFPPSAGFTIPSLLSSGLIAGAGGAAGEGIRQGILRATGAEEQPQTFGEAARNIGISGLEQAGGEVGGRLLAKPAEWAISQLGPRSLYGKALRPTSSMAASPAERQQLIQTGLNEWIPVTGGGYEKAQSTIGDIDQQAENLIRARSGQPGTQILPSDVARAVGSTRRRFGLQVTPQSDLDAIDRAVNEFMTRNSNPPPFNTQIPLSLNQAQAMKKGTYQMLAGKYGELGSADVEAQKALARGLKEQIAQRVPEVVPLHAREGPLIELLDPLWRSVSQQQNRPIAGWHIPMIDAPGLLSGIAIGQNAIASSPAGQFLAPAFRPRNALPIVTRALPGMVDQR